MNLLQYISNNFLFIMKNNTIIIILYLIVDYIFYRNCMILRKFIANTIIGCENKLIGELTFLVF